MGTKCEDAILCEDCGVRTHHWDILPSGRKLCKECISKMEASPAFQQGLAQGKRERQIMEAIAKQTVIYWVILPAIIVVGCFAISLLKL